MEIQEVSFLDSSGSAKHVFATGEPVTVRLKVSSTGAIEDFVFGVAIFNADGVCCYGTNTHLEEFTPVRFSGTGEVRFVIPELQLVEGTYFLDVAAHQRDGYPFDYHRALHQFRVQSKVKDVGIYRPSHRWEFVGDVRGRSRRGFRGRREPDRRSSAAQQMAAAREALRERGLRVVFTNGCFDLLHPGHVRYLQEARSLGDRLIVAVNGDATVARLKGEGRPLTPLDERMEVLAALACVDYVVAFEEETPFEIIEEIVPDVLVKGGDWTPDRIVGRERVEREGGKVLSLPYAPGYSTSGIIERIVDSRSGS